MEGEKAPPLNCTLSNGQVPTSQHEEDNKDELVKIKRCHDEAYLYIEQALNLDENGNVDQALLLYKKGLSCIYTACSTPHKDTQHRGQEWQKARNLIQKMQRSRQQIQLRVESLMQSQPQATKMEQESPPSYEEATGSNACNIDMALDEILHDDMPGRSDSSMSAATELFRIDDGVQIFFIQKDGYVSAPSYPSSLGIYKFIDGVVPGDGTAAAVEMSQVFLKVGDWMYPLLEGQSPVLHANWGAYIFPDVLSSEGNAVGVIMPDYVSPIERLRFEQIMKKYTSLRDQVSVQKELPPSDEEQRLSAAKPVLPPGDHPEQVTCLAEERMSSKISRGIESAAEWLSWGIVKGATKTGQLVKKGSAKLKEHITPESKKVPVDPRAQKGLYYTRKATEGVVMVSSFLVDKLGKATMYVAHKAAPHIREHGEKYLPKCVVQKDSGGQSKLDGALEVAGGGLKGWLTIYSGLEMAAKTLAKSIADETVHVVKHKYGDEVGKATEDTLYTGGNIALTLHYTSNMGVKAIAKRVAKDTGQVLAVDAPAVKQTRVNPDDIQMGTMDCNDKSTELRDH